MKPFKSSKTFVVRQEEAAGGEGGGGGGGEEREGEEMLNICNVRVIASHLVFRSKLYSSN